jgi:hypothetical protein
MAKAGSLFYSTNTDDETLYGRIVPSEEQSENLRKNWNSLADWLREDLHQSSDLPIKTWIQGSYKLGTLIRPVSIFEEYDVDLGVYFCWDNDSAVTPAATQLKDWVQTSLKAFAKVETAVKKVDEPSKERCSRIRYQKQFHIDVPAYHLDEERDLRQLATQTHGWEQSDPKAFVVWFQEKVGNPERTRLRRIVRYLKAWAALHFQNEPSARPTSILLTVLATEAFLEIDTEDCDDEDAFHNVVIAMDDRLTSSTKVPNPVNTQEDLNRMTDEALGTFIDAVAKLREIGDRAVAADDEGAAAVIWDEAFSHLFPLPEQDASIEFAGSTGRAVAALPVVDVDVADQRGNVLNTYRDEVPTVNKDAKLIFRIINPEVIPQWATVDWVVRNAGAEAAAVNDIGHSTRGKRALECEERTAYFGRHFMDCIVRLNGRAIAVKRIPVYVKSPSFIKALPTKPWYRRFVKRR